MSGDEGRPENGDDNVELKITTETSTDNPDVEISSDVTTGKTDDVSKEKPWKFTIPEWFMENNVKRSNESESPAKFVHLVEEIPDAKVDDGKDTPPSSTNGEPIMETKVSEYKILRQEYEEIRGTVSSALTICDPNYLVPEQGILVLRADEVQDIDVMNAIVSQLAVDIGATLTSFDLIDMQSISCDFDSQIRERVRLKLPHPKRYSDYEVPNLTDVSLPNVRVIHNFAALSCTGAQAPLWDGDGPSPKPALALLEASSSSETNITDDNKGKPADLEDVNEDHIVYIRDVDRILNLEKGVKCLESFGDAIRELRENGRRLVLIVSILSGLDVKWKEEPDAEKEPDLLRALRSDMKIQVDSVITVTQSGLSNQFDKAQQERIRHARQIRCALRYSAPQDMLACSADLIGPNPKHDFACDPGVVSLLEFETLSDEKAYRTAKLICGKLSRNATLTIEDIRAMLEIIYKRSQKETSADEQFRRKLKKIKGKCNSYEEGLLDCVVKTHELDTKYEDVVMDDELKETVKQLIHLSQDSSQKHRLLQQAQIKGALFYGPPGTGKTHLTRAIARESGLSMLAVNAGNLEDMWVGEAEKKILATFSLCRKLHPCILFFDEADALFYKRGSCDKSWRRNAITLFLQELDGLRADKTSPFVIVATNRPKDLDDAFMRRLPYKAAFNLPSASEREQILRVFLKEEDITDPMIFELLTRKTEGYSGADLKSLVGQAVLTWSVEQRLMTRNADDTTQPELKLTPQHFVKALRRSRPAATPETMKMNEEFQRGAPVKSKAR